MQSELTDNETLRYNRQIILRGFDFDGQEKLKASSALIVGLGGLGCPAGQYLAAAGIGSLVLLDFDTVSLSNLQRQILHRDKRIGMDKVESARISLAEINPNVVLNTVNSALNDIELAELISQVDIVLDCTDNVNIRNRLNQQCYNAGKPLISAAAIRMEGQISVFTYQPEEPCYRCLSRLFGANALTCVETGVMSPLVGMIGSMQAMETIKVLTHFGIPLSGRLLMIDAMTMQFREMQLMKDPACPVCSTKGL